LFPAPVFQTENSPPVDVVIDDWNVDGFPDLLVANRFVVGMFLGDGNGGFRVRQDIGIESGNDNRQIQSADLNNDGIPDLVVTTRLRMVYVLLGIGDGTFSPRQGYEAGLEANSVAIGDLNGDGAPDLAVTSFNENSLSVFIGNGDGTFQPRSILSTGARAYWVAIADINLDGSVDIAVAKSGGNAVYLGNGDGSFQDRLDLATGHSPGSIALDDVNADGNPDLVSTDLSIDMVSVQLGMGDGGFAMRQDYQVGVQPQSVVVSDLDDNGTLDVTVVNTGSNSTTTLLGDGAGGFSGRIDHPAGRNPRAVSIGDIDLDGALDLALTNGGGSNVSVIFGRGDGTLITRQNYVVGGSGASSLETADFNGDSVVDLVSANTQSDSVSVLLGSSDGSFGDPLVIPTGTDPLVVAVGDFDNNGTPDVSVANLTSSSVSIILGNGDGTFQNRQDIPSLSGAHDVAVGNLDGDGNADLLVATRVGVNNFIHVLLGNGDGTFQSSLVLGFGQSGFGSIRVVDVNGDQHSDIVIPVVLSNSVRTLLGNGDGTFQTAMSSQAGSEPQTLTSGDVDGDGILDLAVSVRNGVNILLGSGDGFFQLSKSYLNGSNGTAPLELEDFNGDGVLDLVVANTGASVQVLLGMGDGSFGAGQSYQTGVGVTSVAVQDFNGDGAMDVASLDSNDQSVSILLNQRVQQSTLFAGEGGSSAHKLPFARGIVRADRYPADVDAKESEQVGSSVHRGLSGNHSALGLTRGAVSRSIRIHAREVRILAQAEANVLLGSDDRHHPKSVLENAIGQVVEGRFDGSTGFTSAVLIDTDGKEIRLPALGAQGSMFPVAINPRGDVIGFSSVGEGWVWRYAEPVEIESIGTLGGRGSVATFWLGVVGVLGQADTPDGSNRAILWVPGDGLLDMSRFVEDQRITLDTVLGVLPGGVVIASGSDEHGHKVVVSIELVLSESVLGDVDGNGLVDEFDARLVMELIEDQNPVGDLNSDGVMDMRDLALVIRNLGMSSSEIEIESGR
jgi:hypothetical protein